MAKMLLADEQVLLAVKQSRLKALFTPDTIVVTTQRIIRYSPSGFLGIRKDIEDYRYEDIANFKISKGLMFAKVTIGHRFMSESLILDDLRNGQTIELSKAIEQNLARVRGSTASPPRSTISQDSLEALKLRFARGEITKEQFEDMKRTLA
jgi:hypothetical protein